MNKILFLCLLPIIGFAQVQIGENIVGEASGDRSGWSVSTSSDGTVVAIGAYLNDDNGSMSGHVRVYRNINDAWVQLGQDIEGDSSGDHSGYSVSLSANGEILAIGSPRKNISGSNAGHVRVFAYNAVADEWSQLGSSLDNGVSGDRFGFSVSLSADGNTLAIGAPTHDPGGLSGGLLSAGQVRIYNYLAEDWVQVGETIFGEEPFDELGQNLSISADGSIIAIGAGGSGAGNGNKLKLYQNIDNTWVQLGNTIIPETTEEELGYAITLSADGTTVAAGISYNENGVNLGKTRVYQLNENNWSKIGEDIDTAIFPRSVSLSYDGGTVAIGIPNANTVKVFEYTSSSWSQIGNDIVGENDGDFNGCSVSLSDDGNIIAVGAYSFDQNGTDKGLVRVFDFNPSTDPTEVYLLVEILGQGSISPDYDSETPFEVGEEITVEAVPADGYIFDKFVIEGEEFTNNPIDIVMNNTVMLAVVFEEDGSFSTHQNVLNDMNLHPNPASQEVKLQLDETVLLNEISVYSYTGQKVKSTKSAHVDVSDLKSGVYFFQVSTDKGRLTKKIIVK